MRALVSCLLLNAALAMAQGSVEFAAASIKPSSPQEQVFGLFTHSGGRLVGTNLTLEALIGVAYEIDLLYVDGGPKWAYEARYSIDAVPPPDSTSAKYSTVNSKLPPPQEELEMLRSLLRERFALRIREEKREGPVLALTVSERGHKLSPPKDREEFQVVVFGVTGIKERPNFLEAHNASMERIGRRFADMLGTPVVDRTNVAGNFDFRIEYAQNPATSDGPALTTAIQDLGLRLTPSRGEVRYLVIEAAEPPGEN